MVELNITVQSSNADRHLAKAVFASASVGQDAGGISVNWVEPAPVRPSLSSDLGLVLLEVALPGRFPVLGGFILLDHAHKQVFVRARSAWEENIDPMDREILLSTRKGIETLFQAAGFEAGKDAVKELSNTIRSTGEFAVSLSAPARIAADILSSRLFEC